MPLVIAFIVFLTIYPAAQNLPVLGDGAYHTQLMREIANSQSINIETAVYYPLFYHLFGALVYKMFGIEGVKIISPLMMTLAALLVYLIALKLTQSKLVGLLSMILVAFSARIIWYGAQIVMEPFLIFLILFSVYTLILACKNTNRSIIILAALAVGAVISTKQNALAILPAALLFLLISRVSVKRIMLFTFIVLLFAVGPYSYMWSTTHTLVAPYADYSMIEDTTLNRILYDGNLDNIPSWSYELTAEANANEVYRQGTVVHESRHIYIWDMVNKEKFLFTNNLYDSSWYGYTGSKDSPCLSLLYGLFIVGFIMMLIYSIKRKDWRIIPIFLVFSYLAMYFGSDTKRYFLYIPVMLSFVYMLPVEAALKVIRNMRQAKTAKRLSLFTVFVLVVSLALYLTVIGIENQKHTEHLSTTQGYAPSVGGIASIEDVSAWIKASSDDTVTVFESSSTEWQYYAECDVYYDYRILFLSEERVDYYLNLWGIEYVIVRDNAIIADAEWNHVQKYPQSFVAKIADMYPLLYTSSFDDIKVYAVN